MDLAAAAVPSVGDIDPGLTNAQVTNLGPVRADQELLIGLPVLMFAGELAAAVQPIPRPATRRPDSRQRTHRHRGRTHYTARGRPARGSRPRAHLLMATNSPLASA